MTARCLLPGLALGLWLGAWAGAVGAQEAPAPAPPAPPEPVVSGTEALAATRDLTGTGRARCEPPPIDEARSDGEIVVCARPNPARLSPAERRAAGVGAALTDGLPRAVDRLSPMMSPRIMPGSMRMGGAMGRAVTPNPLFDRLQALDAERAAAEAAGAPGAGGAGGAGAPQPPAPTPVPDP